MSSWFSKDESQDGYRPVTLEAHDLVFGDRNGAYGHPLDDFTCTAAMWSAYLIHRGLLVPGSEIIAEDVGPMMAMVKLSRQANAPRRDNLVDLAGYAETTERVIYERERRGTEEEALLETMEQVNEDIALGKLARELGLQNQDLQFPTDDPVNCDQPTGLFRRVTPLALGCR